MEHKPATTKTKENKTPASLSSVEEFWSGLISDSRQTGKKGHAPLDQDSHPV